MNSFNETVRISKGTPIVIKSDEVIVNLLRADKKEYLPIARLFRFVSYLRQQLESSGYISDEVKLIFDVNFESIERTIRFNNKYFDLIGEEIYFKGEFPELKAKLYSDEISQIALRFVEECA